jgi:hypothetical protein
VTRDASSRDARFVYRASLRARMPLMHAALHHPPVHSGYHPPSRRWRGGRSGAPRRRMRGGEEAWHTCMHALPCFFDPRGSSRMRTVFCTAQPGVYTPRSSAELRFSPAVAVGSPVTGSRPGTLRSVGCSQPIPIPDDPQLLLLLTSP